MTDYGCFPIWHYGGNNFGDIDPVSLGLSEGLISSLMSWAATYDSTLDPADPTNAGFPSNIEENNFVRNGLALAKKLKAELKSYDIYYFQNGQCFEVRI